jgi:hypothetical protein
MEGVDAARSETISQLTLLYGFYLRPKVPLPDVAYAISMINYTIQFGKFKEGDMGLLRDFFHYWFGVGLVLS